MGKRLEIPDDRFPMTSWEVNGEFRGLKLPRKVVEKIYHGNAEKMFPGI